jgi:hypothetical protein
MCSQLTWRVLQPWKYYILSNTYDWILEVSVSLEGYYWILIQLPKFFIHLSKKKSVRWKSENFHRRTDCSSSLYPLFEQYIFIVLKSDLRKVKLKLTYKKQTSYLLESFKTFLLLSEHVEKNILMYIFRLRTKHCCFVAMARVGEWGVALRRRAKC